MLTEWMKSKNNKNNVNNVNNSTTITGKENNGIVNINNRNNTLYDYRYTFETVSRLPSSYISSYETFNKNNNHHK